MKDLPATTIDSVPFRGLLERVSLEGSIEQCVMEISEGVAGINAVDMTNSTFLSVSEKLAIPDCTLGLCNLSNIIKILAHGGEFQLSAPEGKSLVLKKKGFGTAHFPLMVPEEVPTAVPGEKVGNKILSQCDTKFLLAREALEKVEFFSAVFPSEIIRVVGKSGSVRFTSAEMEQSRFIVFVGAYKGDDFTTQVYSTPFRKSLKVVFSRPPEEVENVTILSGEKMPVIVHANSKNFWAITPIIT